MAEASKMMTQRRHYPLRARQNRPLNVRKNLTKLDTLPRELPDR